MGEMTIDPWENMGKLSFFMGKCGKIWFIKKKWLNSMVYVRYYKLGTGVYKLLSTNL
jgi:hypothetical protein